MPFQKRTLTITNSWGRTMRLTVITSDPAITDVPAALESNQSYSIYTSDMKSKMILTDDLDVEPRTEVQFDYHLWPDSQEAKASDCKSDIRRFDSGSGLIYLASPYSSVSTDVLDDRFSEAQSAVIKLIKRGFVVYSPIVHSHPLATIGDLPSGWEFWSRQDLAMLDRADLLMVLKIAGWQESKGVGEEIKYAEKIGLPICFLDPA